MRRAVLVLGAALGLVVGTAAQGVSDPRIERLTKDAERLRGLTLREPLKVREIDRKELPAELRLLERQEPDPQVTPQWEAIYHLLGVLPRSKRLAPTLRAGLADAVAGAYLPSTDELLLVSAGDSEATATTIVHEIVHAIQDQRFDLSGGPYAPRPSDIDGQTAALAIVEGDATEVMTRHLLASGIGGVLGELAGAFAQLSGASGADTPPYFTRRLLMPYDRGERLAERIRARRGRAGLDRALRKPPRTSAAVWFPERYLAGDPPPARVTVGAPRRGERRVVDTTFGVFDLVALTDDDSLAGRWRGGRLALDSSRTRRTLRLSIATTGAPPVARALRRTLPRAWRIRVAGRTVIAVVNEARP